MEISTSWPAPPPLIPSRARHSWIINKENKTIVIERLEELPAPQQLLKLISCSCKKGLWFVLMLKWHNEVHWCMSVCVEDGETSGDDSWTLHCTKECFAHNHSCSLASLYALYTQPTFLHCPFIVYLLSPPDCEGLIQSRAKVDLWYLLLLPNTKKSYKHVQLKTYSGCHGTH